MGLFTKKENKISAFNEELITDKDGHKEMEIPSQWSQFLTLKNEMTTKAYAISEFIDNSISSYVKMTGKDNEFYDLRINIRIFQKKNDSTGKVEQSIIIEDNAEGMTEKQLFRSIIMNDTENKSSSDLNQYGYGMKLGIFWLGQGFEIHTKNHNENTEYYTRHLIDTVEKANERAFVRVYKAEGNKQIITQKSGTTVEVLKIHEENLFEVNEIQQDLKQKIAFRYSECIGRGLTISILFQDLDDGIEKVIRLEKNDGKIYPYVLSDVIRYYQENEKISFNKEKYLHNLQSKLDTLDESKLLEFTSNISFKKTLISGYPLVFSFKRKVNNVETTFNWGIVAMNDCKKNNFSYSELSGFKLLHNCRAIIHGPNESSAQKKNKNLNMRSFSIPTEASGGNTTWIRIFGDIDLTNIERPERNKRGFSWSARGQQDISEVLGVLWRTVKDFSNLLKDMEEDESIEKSYQITKRSKTTFADGVKKIISVNKIDSIKTDDNNPEFTIKNMNIFGDNKPVVFKIFPISESTETKALDIQKKGSLYVEIIINLKHNLFRYYCSSGNAKDLVYSYVLAIALAICKFRYDNLIDKNYSYSGSAYDTFNFDEIFNDVLRELSE